MCHLFILQEEEIADLLRKEAELVIADEVGHRCSCKDPFRLTPAPWTILCSLVRTALHNGVHPSYAAATMQAHILKNDKSATSKAMNQLTNKKKIALTGYPLQVSCGFDLVRRKWLRTSILLLI